MTRRLPNGHLPVGAKMEGAVSLRRHEAARET
jgi:hypothetical protein